MIGRPSKSAVLHRGGAVPGPRDRGDARRRGLCDHAHRGDLVAVDPRHGLHPHGADVLRALVDAADAVDEQAQQAIGAEDHGKEGHRIIGRPVRVDGPARPRLPRPEGGQPRQHGRRRHLRDPGPMLEKLQSMGEYRLLVLPDHSTPCATKKHSHGMVPLAVCGSGITPSGAGYDEIQAAAAPLAFSNGWEMMGAFLRGNWKPT